MRPDRRSGELREQEGRRRRRRRPPAVTIWQTRSPMRVGRGQVLAYRAAVHDLDGGRGAGAGALGAGLRDNPPGRTARLALALRKGRPEAPDTVLVHSVRAAMNLNRVD